MRHSVIYGQGDTSWGGYVPDLPGCVAVGDSRVEVGDLIVDAVGACIDDLREAGILTGSDEENNPVLLRDRLSFDSVGNEYEA